MFTAIGTPDSWFATHIIGAGVAPGPTSSNTLQSYINRQHGYQSRTTGYLNMATVGPDVHAARWNGMALDAMADALARTAMAETTARMVVAEAAEAVARTAVAETTARVAVAEGVARAAMGAAEAVGGAAVASAVASAAAGAAAGGAAAGAAAGLGTSGNRCPVFRGLMPSRILPF